MPRIVIDPNFRKFAVESLAEGGINDLVFSSDLNARSDGVQKAKSDNNDNFQEHPPEP
jgi:hypothetical protein